MLKYKTYIPLNRPYSVDLSLEPILGFWGENEFMSNFFVHPVVTKDGILPSSEHAYMIQKDDDPAYKKKIREARTPGIAKRLGYKAKLKNEWDSKLRFQAMFEALKCKFMDPEMARRLLATGRRYLEETNFHRDKFWGRCGGEGRNHLGRMLMVIRQMLRDMELIPRAA